ncbi:g patch domain-containing protein 1 [Holotrichia oblita]|uniref:G patch domain-containing protein 1 n=1 Tax=Holotrichia oblita TaxID=644536 RepID=A0ACB9TWX3_HOLOL|nr:g patch domain-containing protein 1 [Holotrichia oblita]
MSDSEDENFCFYGKALEPYDEDAVPKKKPISIEDQIATDAQGRRRFHGAFTGGFSAGFYNTVGSLEGWKPADFKSSRSEKAQSKHLRPEDFMDDEDIGEHGIAPQTVKATNDYASNRKRKKQMFSDGPIPGEPVLHTLITSGNETIGYLLMKNMDLKQKSKESEDADLDGPKVYGCVMPKTYEIRRNIDYEDAIPEIYANQIKNPKSNSFGLGYEGLDKSHLNLFKSTQFIVKDKDNKKLSISGQAFGVGAFENEDEDIYAKDDMSQYDFELTGEKKAASSTKRNDMIFERFVLSKVPLLSPQKFPPPIIPHSFSGKHKVKKSRFEPVPEEKVERRDMTAHIRAKYIGEEETPPKPGCSSEVVNITPTLTETSPNITKNETQRENSEGNYGTDLFLDKFVSASQPENPHNILEVVTKSESEHGTKEMRDAAKLKMYGPLTRIISDWQPCSLLCKRFNVREPLLE